MSVLPLKERLRQLAIDKGTTVERTLLAAYDPEIRGTSPTFMKKVLGRERRPNRAMLEALARALGEPPTVFVEYRMLSIRDALDDALDDTDGFDTAVQTLETIESALGGGSTAADTADQIAARAALEASLGDAARRADVPPRASPGTRRVPRARRGPRQS